MRRRPPVRQRRLASMRRKSTGRSMPQGMVGWISPGSSSMSADWRGEDFLKLYLGGRDRGARRGRKGRGGGPPSRSPPRRRRPPREGKKAHPGGEAGLKEGNV